MKLKNSYYCARFYITYRCNSKCSYCNVWRDEHFKNKSELTLEQAKKLMKECADIGIKYIDFTGGEPTLYPYLVEVVEYAKSLGIKTEVTSNCVAKSSITKNILNNIAKVVNKFNISLDTLQPSIYMQVRGIDACEQVKNRIQEVAKFRQPKIMTVVSDQNIKDLDKIITFAQENKALIYLSPVFPYIDKQGNFIPSKYLEEIVQKVFDPYTIVLLHFMEFFKNSDFSLTPPCSANKMTITLAPNGNIVLPCYHAIKEEIVWDRPLSELINTNKFLEYQEKSSKLPCCQGCRVIPYMGISFSYKYDKYFLLQSYSERLSQLKRDYINDNYASFNLDKRHLHQLLKNLITLCLDVKSVSSPGNFYYSEKVRNGYKTDIFKELLSESEHLENIQAKDCWDIKRSPVYFCNIFEREILRYLKKEKPALLKDVLEFQLRWWIYFISEHLNLKKSYDNAEDKKWLINYFEDLSKNLPQKLRSVFKNQI